MRSQPRLCHWLALLSMMIVTVACSVRSSPEATQVPSVMVTQSIPQPAPLVSPAVETTPSAVPSPAPVTFPTATMATTATPGPTPVPAPAVSSKEAADCCGLLSWMEPALLAVYDTPRAGDSGTWLVSATDDGRRFLTPGFGLANGAGLIAVSRPVDGLTEIRRTSGETLATIRNGGTTTWISPDGSRAAWLERLPGRTPSSSANRLVRLWISASDGSDQRAVADLQAAELNWLSDSHRIVISARAPDGGSPGIWLIDTDSGALRILLDAPFPQAVRVSPNGRFFSYLVTFSGDAKNDGLWIGEVDGPLRTKMSMWGGYRWHSDSSSIWVLELNADASGQDQLVRIDAQTGLVVARTQIGGSVRDQRWEIDPSGRAIAYWREQDGRVVIEPLRP